MTREINIPVKAILRKSAVYAVSPQIMPRFRELGLGFEFLAVLMAQIFAAVRILPPGHACLNPANYGRYTIIQVMAAAASCIKANGRFWHAPDQIIIFALLLTAFVVLCLQFAGLIAMIVIDTAQAADGSGGGPFSIFITPNPERDMAFMMLDQVFGIPYMFGSMYAPESAADVPPFNKAMMAMFAFYSNVTLVVGGGVLCYYFFVMLVETAQTGTPFGQRFPHVYGPIRLVFCLFLLVPVNFGMNAGQFATLYAAKLGSGLATNAWLHFNRILVNPTPEGPGKLLAKPKVPDVMPLTEFFLLANICKYHYENEITEPREVGAYLVRVQSDPNDPYGNYVDIDAAFSGPGAGVTLGTALQFYKGGNVLIRFGHRDPDLYPELAGNVKPLCGEILMQTNNLMACRSSGRGSICDQVWDASVQNGYFQLIKHYWGLVRDGPTVAERFYKVVNEPVTTAISSNPSSHPACTVSDPTGILGRWGAPCHKMPGPGIFQEIANERQAWFQTKVDEAYDMYTNPDNPLFSLMGDRHPMRDILVLDPEVLDLGWGGASIFYNKIAEYNGAFVTNVVTLPDVVKYPDVMEQIRVAKAKSETTTEANELFKPNLPAGQMFQTDAPENMALGNTYYLLTTYFHHDDTMGDPQAGQTNNVIVDVFNMLFGSQGIVSIRENRDVNPLAQLSSLGRGLIDTAIRNLMTGSMASMFGGAAGVLDKHTGKGLGIIAGAFMSLALMGLTLGLILYYVIPFMPFLYFFFAVAKWVKTIFEAMAGVPLWAIAHLRFDGNGLPGSAASNGYFLILEIFIRPTMTVMGLIAAISIFSAQAVILNDVFELLIANLTGFDHSQATDDPTTMIYYRHQVDEFFFTILYVIIIWMMATASFKLIDVIPNQIMRWSGMNLKSFSDTTKDPAEGLVRNVAIGTQYFVGQPAVKALQEGAEATGKAPVALGSDIGSLANRLAGGGGARIKGTP